MLKKDLKIIQELIKLNRPNNLSKKSKEKEEKIC
jgi:hypothetical protein